MNELFQDYLKDVMLYSEFSDDLNASLIDLEFDIFSGHISKIEDLDDLRVIFKIYYLTVIDYALDDLLLFRDPVFYESEDIDVYDLDVFSFSKGLVLIKFKLLYEFINKYTSVYYKDSILFKKCMDMMYKLPTSELTDKIIDLYDPFLAQYDRFVSLSKQLLYYIHRYIEFLMFQDVSYLSSELKLLGYVNAIDLLIPFETRYNQFLIFKEYDCSGFDEINQHLLSKEANGGCKTLMKSVSFI